MKCSESLSVGEILDLYINHSGNRSDFDRRKIEYVWAEIVGPTINHATVRRHVEGDVLHVYLSSGPLKSELAFVTEPLIKALNAAVGAEVITKIAIH